MVVAKYLRVSQVQTPTFHPEILFPGLDLTDPRSSLFSNFSELTLVEPEVCPPLHGHEVPEPLVRRLMVHHDGHPLLTRLRGVGWVHQDATLPDNKDILYISLFEYQFLYTFWHFNIV